MICRTNITSQSSLMNHRIMMSTCDRKYDDSIGGHGSDRIEISPIGEISIGEIPIGEIPTGEIPIVLPHTHPHSHCVDGQRRRRYCCGASLISQILFWYCFMIPFPHIPIPALPPAVDRPAAPLPVGDGAAAAAAMLSLDSQARPTAVFCVRSRRGATGTAVSKGRKRNGRPWARRHWMR